MPYVNKETRDRYENLVVPLADMLDYDADGALNYVVTRLCLGRLASAVDGKPCYADFNAVIGVLECAKQELYRRAVAEYEDKKIEENGDVYPNVF